MSVRRWRLFIEVEITSRNSYVTMISISKWEHCDKAAAICSPDNLPTYWFLTLALALFRARKSEQRKWWMGAAGTNATFNQNRNDAGQFKDSW